MIQVIERAFLLLRELQKGDRSLSELAKHAGLSTPATHNILKTLESVGAVGRGDNRSYRLGQGLFELAKGLAAANTLATIAEECVAEVSKNLRESSTLAIYEKGVRRILAKADSDQTVTVRPETGEIHSPFEAATGLVMMSFVPDADFAEAEKKYGLKRSRFSKEIAAVRELGFAERMTEDGQIIQLAVGIDAPDGRHAAAIGVSIPVVRMNSEKKNAVVAELRRAAKRIGEKIPVLKSDETTDTKEQTKK